MRFILLVVSLCCFNLAAYSKAPAPLSPQSRFEVTGDWLGGSTVGHPPGRSTLYSNSPKAAATWHPAIQSACPIRVSFWVSPDPRSTPAARLEIGRTNQVAVTREINLQLSPPRWETIGVYQFDGSGSEFIQRTKTKNGNLRTSVQVR
jgi:hypothetical protein